MLLISLILVLMVIFTSIFLLALSSEVHSPRIFDVDPRPISFLEPTERTIWTSM
jgi:hypothetical protein